jgi:hypothetical protein
MPQSLQQLAVAVVAEHRHGYGVVDPTGRVSVALSQVCDEAEVESGGHWVRRVEAVLSATIARSVCRRRCWLRTSASQPERAAPGCPGIRWHATDDGMGHLPE